MSYGTGEWRQLLLDMQEIVDWLSRAGQELMSQQPIASDIEMVQQQNKNHQVGNYTLSITLTQSLSVVLLLFLKRNFCI